MKFYITESEKKSILKMYGLLNEDKEVPSINPKKLKVGDVLTYKRSTDQKLYKIQITGINGNNITSRISCINCSEDEGTFFDGNKNVSVDSKEHNLTITDDGLESPSLGQFVSNLPNSSNKNLPSSKDEESMDGDVESMGEEPPKYGSLTYSANISKDSDSDSGNLNKSQSGNVELGYEKQIGKGLNVGVGGALNVQKTDGEEGPSKVQKDVVLKGNVGYQGKKGTMQVGTIYNPTTKKWNATVGGKINFGR